MAFMQVKKGKETIGDSSGGKFIGESGIYPVTLKIVSIDTNEHNARSLNFNVEYEGSNTTLYGLRLENNDGAESFQAKLFHKLGVIAGLDEFSDPEIQTHKLGKDGIEKDLLVLTDFEDLPVKIRVQREYSRYNGEIKSRLAIKGFYRDSDGATADEINEGTDPGIQILKDEKYAKANTYKDGVTEEEAKAWEDSRRSGRSAPATQQAATNTFSQPAAGADGFPG